MADPKTLRVLTLNGGGMRGYMSTVFLQRFINEWRAAGMVGSLADNFDVIAGTSIGAIQALYYGLGKDGLQPEGQECQEVLNLFENEGPWMFTIKGSPFGCQASNPSNRPSGSQKTALVLDDEPFYKSHCPFEAVDIDGGINVVPSGDGTDYSRQGSNQLYTSLNDILGDAKLSDMQTTVFVPALNISITQPTYFSNYDGHPVFQGKEELARNIAMASSAAPVYLPFVEFGGQKYLDGGLFQNDPSNLAMTLAKIQQPQFERICVLNIGTGGPHDHRFSQPLISSPIDLGETLDLMVRLMTVGIAEVAKTTATDLYLRSRLTLEDLYYYTFNPVLGETDLDISTDAYLNGGGDGSSAENPVKGLRQIADEWYDVEQSEITNFIGHLTA